MTKKLHFRLFFALVFLLVGVSSVMKAQIPLVGWDCNPIVNGSNLFGPSPFTPTTTAANVTAGSLIRGVGVGTTGTGASRAFGGVGFNVVDAASAIAANKFFTFTINANSGYNLSLSSINPFDYRRSSTGPPNALLQYSINAGPYVDITTISFPITASSGGSAGPIDLSAVSALQNLPSSDVVNFRIVPYGASGATGTWYIFDVANTTSNDFVVNGTVTSANSLTGGSLTFPTACVNTLNIQNTSISGSGLNGSNVVVGPYSGFGFSINPFGPFDPSVTVSYGGSILPPTTIYVQYAPIMAGSNSGNIPLVGGGLTSTIPVTAIAASPVATIASSTNVSCFGGANGAATVSVTGGSGSNSFDWAPGNPVGDGTPSVSGLIQGSYTCTVTDVNGCVSNTSVSITQPTALNLTSNFQINVTCFGGNTGVASVSSATGGAGGYTYDWTPGNPVGDGTTTITSLATGSYTCTVTDANSCTASISFTIVEPSALNLTSNFQINVTCSGGNTGVASVSSATGGVGGYTYDWTPGNPVGDGTTSVTSLAAGSYTCTVTDANSCTASISFTIVEPSPVILSSLSQTNVSCFGFNNGAASVNPASGGAGGYTYDWTPGNPVGDGTTSVSGLSLGAYTCTVTDANSCTASQTFNITGPAGPLVVTASSNPSPANVCVGSSLTLMGGGATTYTWTDGTNTPTDGVSFVPASASTYTVTGTDGNGCTGTSTLSVTLNAFNPGSSAPVPEVLYYKFDGTGTSVPNLASAPPSGTATATIMGGISQGGVGQSGGALVGSGISSTTDYLNTGYTPSLGTGSWTISFWSQGIGTNPTGTLYYIFGDIGTSSFRCFTNGVAGAGNWILRGAGLTDVYINGGAQLTPTLNTYVYDATLHNVKAYLNGVLVSTITQIAPNLTGTGPLKVMGYNSNVGAPLGGKLDEFRIYSHALTPAEVLSLLSVNPSFSATATPNMVCPGSTVALESTGGIGIVSYSWDPGSLSGNPVNAVVSSSTVYTVTATDNNGCTGSTTTTVNTYPAVSISATSTPSPATVCQGNNVTLNGTGASTYTWTDGTNTPVDGVAFAPASSSTYTVTGTDGNGCTGTSSLIVTVNPTPTVTAAATPSTTCNNSSVTPMGGGASTYVWTGGLTDNTPFVATTGTTTYTVTGTDGIGCTATSSVTVTVNAASGNLASITSSHVQTQSDDFNLSYYDPSCNLIASVDDGVGGNTLGITTATVNVDANAGSHNGQPFVRRWYQITPSNNVGVSAMVTLYIDQADFTNYNLSVVAPYLPMPTSGNNADPNISNIRITKNSDGGLGNTPEVITPSVNWNGMYWELSFSVTGFSQFRVHSVNPANTPLPATITKFSGRKLNSSDMLEWTTSSEQNNAYFNLQHSTNGVDFKTIAKVNSKAQNGNSQTELNYSYEHATPSLGHNYYRLEQVDIDNHSTLNAKIVDLIWGANGSTVSLYPNPTHDVLNIDLYTNKVQNTTVKVLDMSGRVVKQIQARSEAGMSTLSISLSELASGVYTVQVYDNDKLSHVGKVKKND